MNSIKRIIYVPTLRCNCACKHCGQSRYFQEEECDCGLIRERLWESDCRPELFSITGGEPFLNNELPQQLARIVNEVGCFTDITTNGICVEAIQAFVDRVADAQKLLFSVSIDGMPDTHNRIRRNQDAFGRAVKTIKALKERGVPVKVNTVIQRDNCWELDIFKDYICECVGDSVEISWIPLISEINGRDVFPYNEDETAVALFYVSSAVDKAYLLSRGTTKIKACHAGTKTAVISPSGKVYSCLTGFSYKSVNRRESFLIGDLKKQSLNEIAALMASPEASFRAAVRSCEGCWNPCEVGHEIQYWGIQIECSDVFSNLKTKCGVEAGLTAEKAPYEVGNDLDDISEKSPKLWRRFNEVFRYRRI